MSPAKKFTSLFRNTDQHLKYKLVESSRHCTNMVDMVATIKDKGDANNMQPSMLHVCIVSHVTGKLRMSGHSFHGKHSTGSGHVIEKYGNGRQPVYHQAHHQADGGQDRPASVYHLCLLCRIDYPH